MKEGNGAGGGAGEGGGGEGGGGGADADGPEVGQRRRTRRERLHLTLLSLLTQPRELVRVVQRRWLKFTRDREDYSLWIFKQQDK